MVERASAQLIYFFGAGEVEGDPTRADRLGGKGASLSAMTQAGLPVPPGFVIDVEACRHYHAQGGKWPDGLEQSLEQYVARLEKATGKRFAQGPDPLLVSVRSGAAQSMPGMMDTILNCGLHPALASDVADPPQFWTVYEGFVRQFGSTVAGIDAKAFEAVVGPVRDADGPEASARACIDVYEKQTGQSFPTDPWDALKACVNAVFDSWNNERAVIYRRSHGLQSLDGTAVTVQAMYNSQVSGIAFTANPANPMANEIVIESAYGLGEAIVSGDVAPDRFVLDAATHEIKTREIGRKEHVFAGLGHGGDGNGLDPDSASLTDAQITELASVARDVEDHFGHPVDIEWGLVDGSFALLQARAIRGLDVARELEPARQAEIDRLRQLVTAEGKDKTWVIHNLAETLEAPTPLSWDIISRFMAGDGGFGKMYRDFGYRPSQRVREQGFLELICGRIYADVDRAAELFWEGMPFEYDHERVREDPRLLESAPTKFEADRTDGKFLLRLPGTIWAMIRSVRRVKRMRRAALDRFENEILPAYRRYVDEQRGRDLSPLDAAALIDELNDRRARVLTDFGKESLKPGFFGGLARAELENVCVQLLGPDKGEQLARTLSSGLDGDPTLEQNQELFEVARGDRSLDDFLERYGHRAVGEMELSRPRWREDPSYLQQIIASLDTRDEFAPHTLHEKNAALRKQAIDELPETLAEVGGSFLRERIEALVDEVGSLLPYREAGKHYLLMGYELIRDVIVELGKRLGIGDDVFYLTLEELPAFEQRRDELTDAIAERKVRFQAFQRLDMPDVVDSRHLEALGQPRDIESASELEGQSLSPGIFTGTARIVHSPGEARDLPGDCVLICPSTDPAWTALFTTIKALVVERGGVLSHGAITARDFGVPAVACPDATRIIDDAARVRVDGDRGRVTIIEDEK